MKTEETVQEQGVISQPPWFTVPIMATVTEEDQKKADNYQSSSHCIIATMLKREGWGKQSLKVYSDSVYIDGHRFTFDGSPRNVGWLSHLQQYAGSAIGKQFIFYPSPYPLE